MPIERPQLIKMEMETRLNVSQTQAIAYLAGKYGPANAKRLGQAYVEEFPQVTPPKANWQTILSQAHHQGLVRKVARGLYVEA